jgi:butyryl-CoA dehydrogenase
MVGLHAVSTATVAYLESLENARTRPQGRPLSAKDPTKPQVPIVAHADVRRMLLRQKAIVEGGLALLARVAMFADLAAHATDEAERSRAQELLDLLTPIAKTFPAEKGFESNALALQIHGGYGYSSDYLPEAWLREQKLNSIHEGTTGIQSLDLLGRKAVARGGAPLALLREEIEETCARAEASGVRAEWTDAVRAAMDRIVSVTMDLGARGMAGDVEGMLLHSADYLEMFSIVVVGWIWIALASCAAGKEDDFYVGKMRAAQYWIATELPRTVHLAQLCTSGEDSYATVPATAL